MKQHMLGMVLLTTLCLLSVIACLWLSSMHLVLLFKKVTCQLQERHFAVKTLENDIASLIQEKLPEMPAECIVQQCLTPSGVVFQVEKMNCYPCLTLREKGAVLGSQHWLIKAQFQEKQLVVRLATPAECGVCVSDVISLRSPILSWYL